MVGRVGSTRWLQAVGVPLGAALRVGAGSLGAGAAIGAATGGTGLGTGAGAGRGLGAFAAGAAALRGFAFALGLALGFAFAAARRAVFADVFLRAALRFGAALRRVVFRAALRRVVLRFAAFFFGTRFLADFFFPDFLRTAMTWVSPFEGWMLWSLADVARVGRRPLIHTPLSLRCTICCTALG
jgi:hypothetical protein